MKHSQEMQERLIKQFSFWRFQGELISRGFKGRGYAEESKNLLNAVEALDKLWFDELGPGYVDELLRLAKEYDGIHGFDAEKPVNLKLVNDGGAND